MKQLQVDFWPFHPRQPDELRRWWKECYLPGSAEEELLGQPFWSLLYGGSASGKSTVLASVLHQLDASTLVIHYGPDQWPEPSEMPEVTHLARMMRLVAIELRAWVKAYPDLLKTLYTTQKEFLRWLLDTFIDKRAYIRLIDSLPPEIEAIMRPVAYELMYDEQSIDVLSGQIEELLTLCHKLHKEHILVVIDINGQLGVKRRKQLEELFAWLDLKQHDGLQGIIALSDLERGMLDWKGLGRGRIASVELSSTPERCFEIVNRHICAATSGAVQSLADLLTPGQLECLNELIWDTFPDNPPGMWLKLAEMLLEEVQKTGCPLSAEQFDALRRQFYTQHVWLYFNPQSSEAVVWRGRKKIDLDPGTFRLMCRLVQQKEKEVDFSDMKQGKENMHTLVHRLRKRIEPEGIDGFVYLINHKSYGYWLEHFVDLSVSDALL